MAKKTFVYQIYLFCFLGLDVSPLVAATRHLKYAKLLGADVVWVGPVFRSPWADHGYDISDHYSIEPRFGTMEEFDTLVAEAHQLDLQVIVDFVPNHTSDEHEWYNFLPDYYCHSADGLPERKNLLSGGRAWQYQERRNQYDYSSFHPKQKDLLWYPKGPEKDVNWELVKQFHRIIDFLTLEHDVDGFRIDIPQAINKDFTADEQDLTDLFFGHQAIGVLNALFGGGSKDLFLMVELFDPTMGELVEYYLSETPVDFALNVLVKDEIPQGVENLRELIEKQAAIPGFMLDLMSHDAIWPTSRGITHKNVIGLTFNTGVTAVCVYNGQELGLSNPSLEELPYHKALDLDAAMEMRFRRGELVQDLIKESRANARIPRFTEEDYECQLQTPDSPLILFIEGAKHWKEQ